MADQITNAVRSVLGEFVSPEKANEFAAALGPILTGWEPAEVGSLRVEVEMLRGEISAYEEEADDLRRESGLDDLEGQVMAAREDADRLRALLKRAWEALSFYSDGFTPRLNKRYGGLEYNPTKDLLHDCGNRAMTVAREIEEAIGHE